MHMSKSRTHHFDNGQLREYIYLARFPTIFAITFPAKNPTGISIPGGISAGSRLDSSRTRQRFQTCSVFFLLNPLRPGIFSSSGEGEPQLSVASVGNPLKCDLCCWCYSDAENFCIDGYVFDKITQTGKSETKSR